LSQIKSEKIKMNKSRYIGVITLLILTATFISSCGYRFPGDPQQHAAMWQGTALKISGKGKKQNPILAQRLKIKLANRLGMSDENSTANKSTTLIINLNPPQRTLILEDEDGRADQYQITITAKPILIGFDKTPSYPTVKGSTTYYELRASATTQTARNSAQTEALQSLSEALVAVITSIKE
jgi:outer membrane lipopolysaccharide assembly protein LptE/RlpB